MRSLGQFIDEILENENYKEGIQHIEKLRNKLRGDQDFMKAIIAKGEFKNAIHENRTFVEDLLKNENFYEDIQSLEDFGEALQNREEFLKMMLNNENFRSVVEQNEQFLEACIFDRDFEDALMMGESFQGAYRINKKLIDKILKNKQFKKEMLEMVEIGKTIQNTEELTNSIRNNKNFYVFTKTNKYFLDAVLKNRELRKDILNLEEVGKATQSNRNFLRFILPNQYRQIIIENEQFAIAMKNANFKEVIKQIENYAENIKKNKKSTESSQDNESDEKLKKCVNNIFWLYEYSIRHFYKFSEHRDSLEDLFKIYDEIMYMLLNSSIEFRNRVLATKTDQHKKKLFRVAMDTFLIFFHNLNYPKYTWLCHFVDFIPNKDFAHLLKVLSLRQRNALEVLHSISFDYGFYAWDFLEKNDVDLILEKCLRGGQNCMMVNVPQFIKRDNVYIDQDIMEISYPETIQRERDFQSDPKYQLTIFIDPDESISVNRIKDEVSVAINKCRRTRKDQKIQFCDKNKVKIVVQVNVKSKKFTERYVLYRIEQSILAYNLSGSLTAAPPVHNKKVKGTSFLNKGMKKQELCFRKNLDLFLLNTTPSYEQRNSADRAIGIWLWDKVNAIEPRLKRSDAIKEILSKKLPTRFDFNKTNSSSKETVKRMLKKEYELADKCIKNIRVEHLSKSISGHLSPGLKDPKADEPVGNSVFHSR